DVIQNPSNLQAAKIGGQRKAGLTPESILTTVPRKLGYISVDSRVLPHECLMDRRAGFAVPHDRGLPLIRDTNCGQVLRSEASLLHGIRDDFLRATPDFFRIVFNPSRLWIDLLVLSLGDRGNAPFRVEHDEPGACGSLIYSSEITCHTLPLWI